MLFDLLRNTTELAQYPLDKQVLTDQQAMQLALHEACRGAGFVSPNPLVGCVILNKENEFLSSGYHQKVGQAHAEINALNNFYEKVSTKSSLYKTEDLVGAKIFVTLEPCAHQGQTGSCAKKLAALPISEVTYCIQDPNPLVSGKGKAILEQSGKKVTCLEYQNSNNDLVSSAKKLCEHFLYNFEKQRTFFSLKVASSLDGMLAMKSGESKWITGELAREYSHFLRFYHDAVLVGANTIAIDDPSLDIRLANPERFTLDPSTVSLKKSKIIIIDPSAKILKNLNQYKISKIHDPTNLIFIVSDKNILSTIAEEKINVIYFQGPKLDINFLDQQLWNLQIRSVLVEGGAWTLSQFLQQKTGQRLYLFQAPIMLGGKNGKIWSENLVIEKLAAKISLTNQLVKFLDPDLLITGKLNFDL